METYTIDSVAFLAFITDTLPVKANDIFEKAENDEIVMLLPSIFLGEIIYTMLKKKAIFGKIIPLEKISLIFEVIRDSEAIFLKEMNLECWKNLLGIPIPELHDRMIVATHLTYQSKAIITNDPEIASITDTIW